METFGCEFIQVYGLTETTGAITQLDGERPRPRRAARTCCARAASRYPWVEVRIVDPETGDDVPIGEVGELWTRSQQNMAGYWANDAATAERDHRRRLVQDRRRRLLRRGRLPVPPRPGQGHDRVRRRERVPGRGRERARRSTRPSPTSPSSACPTSGGARRSRPSSSARPSARRHRRRAHRVRPRAPRRLQAAEVRRLRRRAAAQPVGQAPQARDPRAPTGKAPTARSADLTTRTCVTDGV